MRMGEDRYTYMRGGKGLRGLIVEAVAQLGEHLRHAERPSIYPRREARHYVGLLPLVQQSNCVL